MASKRRPRAPRAARAPNPLADLGILDIPDLEMMDDNDSDVDESALESELEAILSGQAPSKPTRPKKKVAVPMDIESMAAACLKDPDEEDDDDDDSALMDPDLLKELQGLSCDSPSGEDAASEGVHVPDAKLVPTTGDIVSLLEGRLHLYNEAITAAKDMKDNSKVRRYTRAIKTLEGLLKSAKCGRNVNEEDIPPIVSIPKSSKMQPCTNSGDESREKLNIAVEAQKPPSQDENQDLKSLMHRRDEYKVAALHAKRAGDKTTALKYMKISKSFDSVIESLKNGEPVDLSNMPPSPPVFKETVTPAAVSGAQKGLQTTQTSSIETSALLCKSADSNIAHPIKTLQETHISSMEAAALSAASEPEDPEMFAAPPAPTSVLAALQQRLEKYSSTKDAAIAENNNSKVRRLQRIIKSYENAIRDYKAGKPIDFEELPTPPGFAPIPKTSQVSKTATPGDKTVIQEKPSPKLKHPTRPTRPAPQVPSESVSSQKPKIQRTNTSTFDKQLEFLLERQKLFRQAALAAKKNDDMQAAKEYLRMSKGFDAMIEATKCGLPIDASSIPTPPQLQSDFVIIEASEYVEHKEGSADELLETLEKDLTHQIEVCARNKEHFLRLGDVSSASKFEKLGLDARKDLSVIRHLKKTGGPAPKFHYETRLFSMVQCHTDLSDNDLEVTVERGINLPGKPDDLDSYVKVDLPIPSSDSPQKAKTHTIKDTNNPIFQEEFKFEINRKSRSQLRHFKRQALKLEVWSKGGFLRSDTLLGTVNVKLFDLETKCTIHDCFDLMDGRKACGGKLQVKVRIRDPLVVKQVEEVREKWLVIGS